MFKKIINAIFDFASPKQCLVCGALIENISRNYICLKCQDSMPFAPLGSEIIKKILGNFSAAELYIDEAVSLMGISSNSNYMNLIYSLKYQGLPKIGEDLGLLLANVMMKDKLDDFDFIQPVPIHKAKERERTYNQSLSIAKSISKLSGKPIHEDYAIRKVYTQTQTKLSAEDRHKNVDNIFKIKENPYKKVLLVDDVLTTGATINNLAKAFKNTGVEKVTIATLVFIT